MQDPIRVSSIQLGVPTPGRKTLGHLYVGHGDTLLHRQVGCGKYAHNYARVPAYEDEGQVFFLRHNGQEQATPGELCQRCDYIKTSNDWLNDAACAGTDLDFFDPHWSGIEKAVAICNTCPVMRECLLDAEAKDSIGTWGGVYLGQSKANRAKTIQAQKERMGW